MVDPKVTEPGQTRGTGIEGGVSRHLTKGDVITIPAKTPHQWKDTSKSGSVGYFAVNLESH
jgi:mannose-6-phosphate isomerase-like protein (cupin superfamily)